MNIAQAKKNIRDSVKLYLKKDADGNYLMPVVRQRPIFLKGAPGIGKTAIMEQIAQELGIALVSYSMTHHTRQSAIGLPLIEKKNYGGGECAVSEYTMSEIIAAVYDTMEESGLKEGILFLDEINCVSETLYPSMLQFLQYKVFGRHRVPEGWVVVTAGNPPEYNRMVREFDVVTMDRLRLMEVEADVRAFLDYAAERRIHAAILSYLELRKEHFYVMELVAGGREYVTARGWEDLSAMLRLYEDEGLEADESLFSQYLHHETVVKEFAAYYLLYRKYEQEYRIAEILKGGDHSALIQRVSEASFDERVLLSGMLTDRLETDMHAVLVNKDVLQLVRPVISKAAQLDDGEALSAVGAEAERLKERMKRLSAAAALSDAEKEATRGAVRFLSDTENRLRSGENGNSPYAEYIKERYREKLETLKEEAAQAGHGLSSLLSFAEAAYTEESDLLLLLTRITVSDTISRFIALFGNEEYNRLSGKLMVRDRKAEFRDEIRSFLESGE
ncbi:MAG: AAA family ATPase [Lachnospiraceae bacterium]|nr:AAA family ATPase [Lachnospiraceae bacterium]